MAHTYGAALMERQRIVTLKQHFIAMVIHARVKQHTIQQPAHVMAHTRIALIEKTSLTKAHAKFAMAPTPSTVLTCPLKTDPFFKLGNNLNWTHKEVTHAKKTLST